MKFPNKGELTNELEVIVFSNTLREKYRIARDSVKNNSPSVVPASESLENKTSTYILVHRFGVHKVCNVLVRHNIPYAITGNHNVPVKCTFVLPW